MSRPLPRQLLIGVVHLVPLPGSPWFRGDIGELTEHALRDAHALAVGGMNALLLENFGDAPFHKDQVPPETIANLAVVAAEVRRAVKLPLGINVLRNDAHAALAIAQAVGAKFIRVNVHVGAMLTDQGLIEGRAAHLLRLRRSLGADDIRIFADVFVKHAVPLGEQSLLDTAHDTVGRGLADAVILTGPSTGAACSLDNVRSVKAGLPHVPVLVGSGVTPRTIRDTLAVADGVIVGTSLKADGIVTNPVEIARVRELITAARAPARKSRKP